MPTVVGTDKMKPVAVTRVVIPGTVSAVWAAPPVPPRWPELRCNVSCFVLVRSKVNPFPARRRCKSLTEDPNTGGAIGPPHTECD